ncbi:MAG: ABC transporter substrate-binding protein, partial [Geminicoccaceae bacterium]
MRVPGGRRALALVAALIVVAAACGGDDDDTATESEPGGTTGGTDLSEVCPSPLIVQTDWFPEPEHGGLYQLIGPDGEADAAAGTYTGELADTGIDLEIRAGGPFLGGQSTSAQMYADQD